MLFPLRPAFLLLVPAFYAAVSLAQQPAPNTQPKPDLIELDVVVTPKSGPPIAGLQKQDFTVLDNKSPATINSFRELGGPQTPFEIVIVVDDVNTGIEHVAYERTEIGKFLRANQGQLAFPTALAFLTDSGMVIQPTFAKDGNALSASLDQHEVGLHTIQRSSGIYGADERFNISMKAFLELVNYLGPHPGRKMILWVSPGWPLLSGPGVEEQMTSKQREEIYSNVVRITNTLRQGNITLYSIDPLGTADFGGRSFRWEAFEKGISKPNQADVADLSLQVLAFQSGGMVLTTGNDLTQYLEKCLQDTQAFYELSIVPPLEAKPETYHHIEVKVSKAGAVARTRAGYYAQP